MSLSIPIPRAAQNRGDVYGCASHLFFARPRQELPSFLQDTHIPEPPVSIPDIYTLVACKQVGVRLSKCRRIDNELSYIQAEHDAGPRWDDDVLVDDSHYQGSNSRIDIYCTAAYQRRVVPQFDRRRVAHVSKNLSAHHTTNSFLSTGGLKSCLSHPRVTRCESDTFTAGCIPSRPEPSESSTIPGCPYFKGNLGPSGSMNIEAFECSVIDCRKVYTKAIYLKRHLALRHGIGNNLSYDDRANVVSAPEPGGNGQQTHACLFASCNKKFSSVNILGAVQSVVILSCTLLLILTSLLV